MTIEQFQLVKLEAIEAIQADLEATVQASADLALAANEAAEAAASASGNVLFYDTKADADTALSGLPDNQIIEVMADEDVSGLRTRYRVETGAYVFKIIVGEAKVSTVAALRAIPYSAMLTTAQTLGVSAAGDGGDGLWRWDSAVLEATLDNTGTLVRPTGHTGTGAWVRVIDGDVNARWFGLGTADDSTAIQAAIDAATALGVQCLLPASTSAYTIKNTLNLAVGSTLIGDHQTAGFATGTRIAFAPTSQQNLFEIAGTVGTFKDSINVSNLYIAGNSTNATGNSDTAFKLTKVINSRFSNVRVQGFRTGFSLEGTINNRFEYCHASNNYIENVKYSGDTSTTDVWEQFYCTNAPVGIETSGFNLGIRFSKCILESIENYALNLCKESGNFIFDNCYAENIGTSGSASSAMFRVGHDGTTLTIQNQLQVIGGYYTGRNAGAVGSFIDCDYDYGITLANPVVARFTNLIKTSANTRNYSLLSTGLICSSITNIVNDATKVAGYYPVNAINGSQSNNQILANAYSGNFLANIQAGYSVAIGGAAIPADGRSVAFPATQVASTDPNALDDYDEYTPTPEACSGAITDVVGYTLTKIGNLVTLLLPVTEGTASAANYIQYGTTLPAKYRPKNPVCVPCYVKNNGANVTAPGMLLIYTDGRIRFYKDPAAGNFTAGATAGLGQSAGTSVSWVV